MAFFSAGRKATVEAISAAAAIVLEPIVNIEVVALEAAMGNIAGDLSSRRGHVAGTQSGLAARRQGLVTVSGEVLLADIANHASRLKSMTGGQGSDDIEFTRYAQVPPQAQQKLAASFKLKEEDE